VAVAPKAAKGRNTGQNWATRWPKLADSAAKRKSWKKREVLRSPKWAPQAIFGGGASKQDSQMPIKQEREGFLSISAFGLGDRKSPNSPRVCPKMAKGQNKGKMVKF